MSGQQTECNCSTFTRPVGRRLHDINITDINWIGVSQEDRLVCPDFNQDATFRYYLRCYDFALYENRAEGASTSLYVMFGLTIIIFLFVMVVLSMALHRSNQKMKMLVSTNKEEEMKEKMKLKEKELHFSD